MEDKANGSVDSKRYLPPHNYCNAFTVIKMYVKLIPFVLVFTAQLRTVNSQTPLTGGSLTLSITLK